MFKNAYGSFERDSLETGLECRDPSLAVQSQKDEADINVIVARFGIDRIPLPEGGLALPPVDDDFEVGAFDYQSAQNLIVAARESFQALPAKVRSEFENDPARFVKFCSDEKNLDRMRDMGLAVPKVIPAAPGAETSGVT